MGFFFSPDDFGGVASVTYKEDVPAKVIRNFSIGGFLHLRQNFEGANIARQVRLNGHFLLSNYWSMAAAAETDVGLFDPYETRGNGLYGKPTNHQVSASIVTDPRNDLTFTIGEEYHWDNRHKQGVGTQFNVKMKPLSWMENDWTTEYTRTRNQEAWAANGAGYAIFADRSTDQYNFTFRSTMTFARDFTLQFYGQVFLAKGRYENFRRLVTPNDFLPEACSGSTDFNRQALHTNLVLRWEYFPGSTLYLVWSQARGSDTGEYTTSFGQDFNGTFWIPPSNVLLIKVSYLLTI